MKSIRSILILSVVVMSIIVFWLAPGINSAKNTEYVRRYENTDHQNSTTNADTTISKHLHKKQREEIVKQMHEKKVYKEERISSTDKLSEITASMFSRGAQFEEIVIPPPPIDSITHLADTTKIVQ